jgi:hypothetical protein
MSDMEEDSIVDFIHKTKPRGYSDKVINKRVVIMPLQESHEAKSP